jgi:hypothetical protein
MTYYRFSCSEIVEKSSQIGQKLARAPLGRESLSWREEEQECGGGLCRGEEEKIAVAHLYRAKTRVVQMCIHLYRVVSSCRYKCDDLTFVPVGATNRYKCQVFVRDRW